eukprot:CAMPEP_0194366084 /NCGR_PEP_ID=MMETSP0174-20130528/14094_1 /TAXON_ID=216777 /ORGANISM="Proboscia alata, Strain PI-D3" /LENGTH=61 /DNA_ID=CAMNT_0039141067 /DNA_START=173 /DNA_END=358 /DNA_ORIENTATION=+
MTSSASSLGASLVVDCSSLGVRFRPKDLSNLGKCSKHPSSTEFKSLVLNDGYGCESSNWCG